MKWLILISIIILAILLRPVYHEPRVLRNFIPPDVCDYIKETATDKLKPSTISNNKIIDERIRKSETAWLDSNDPTVKYVMEKCVSLTDRPIVNCEKLQVLKYKPGGFYKPHQDCFGTDKNKRMYTCIIGLNDDYEGGETVFPNLHKKYKLGKGDVLIFNTLNDWGKMTSKAIHGGTQVMNGEKWICNLWIRVFPYDTQQT